MQNIETETRRVLMEEGIAGCGQRLVAACSGGRDSICLLHVLEKLRQELQFELCAVYVHHGLRPEADQEAAWLMGLADQWGIPCRIRYVNVLERVKHTGESIEEAARNLRYAVLREEADGGYIVTAHHLEDQAETVLLHLIRGCGLKGLGGMERRQNQILRPFLGIRRERIDEYIQENHLKYMEDASNADDAYTRNWIRVRLLPLLREKNPAISRTLGEMADLLREEEVYMEEEAEKHYSEVCPEGELRISAWKTLPEALRRRLLRLWLERSGGLRDIQSVHIQMLTELCGKQTGSRMMLPGGRVFYKSYDRLCQENTVQPSQAETLLYIDGTWHETPWGEFRAQYSKNPGEKTGKIPDYPYTKWVSCDTITEPLCIRTRRTGDYIGAGGGRKSLKKYMIDQKIPQEQRGKMVLAAVGSHIVWIVTERMSDGCRLKQGEKKAVRLDYRPAGQEKEEVRTCRNQEEIIQ